MCPHCFTLHLPTFSFKKHDFCQKNVQLHMHIPIRLVKTNGHFWQGSLRFV